MQHFGLVVLLIANLRYAANNLPFTCTGGFCPLLIDIYMIQMFEKPIIVLNIETR
jgi:hypothetical protein